MWSSGPLVIVQRLEHDWGGLKIVVRGTPVGVVLEVELVLDGTPLNDRDIGMII